MFFINGSSDKKLLIQEWRDFNEFSALGLSFVQNFTHSSVYTQVNSKCRIQLELETSLGKALIEENGVPLSKSITPHKTFLNQPCGDT